MKKKSAKELAELMDCEYRNAVDFFGLTAFELWSKLKREFALFERQEISRAYLCERMMTALFTHKHGLAMSKHHDL